MTVTALIAEDEGPQRRALARLLTAAWPELEIVAECVDGTSAARAIETQRPTLAFLDIRMAGKSGLEVAHEAGANTQIIFTTAYDQHAVRAFELGAVDYLLKPVTAERLEAALTRVRARLSRSPSDASAAQSAPRLNWITASVGNTIKLIAIKDVLFFQAHESCTRVITQAEEAIIRTPLKDLLPRLDPEAFWQVHRSTIVHLGAIKAVKRTDLGKLEIVLQGSDQILPVSQPFHYRFKGM